MEIEEGLLGKNWEQCERDRNETREGRNNMKAHDKQSLISCILTK